MRSITLLILSILFNTTCSPAQDAPFTFEDNVAPIRSAFGMSGGMGYSHFSTKPRVVNSPGSVFTFIGKPQPDWGGDYWAMNDDGEIRQVFFQEIDADLNARYTLFDKKGDGIFITSGLTFSRYSFAFDHQPQFYYKGYTMGRRIGDLETYAIHAGLGKLWSDGEAAESHLFGRISGSYYLRHSVGGFNSPLDASYKRTMVENGTGYLVTLHDVQKPAFALTFEGGLTGLADVIEASLSVHVPLQKHVFTEEYIFLKNNQPTGRNLISYGTFHATAMLRIGFHFFKTYRKTKKTKTQTRPTPEINRLPETTADTPIPETIETGTPEPQILDVHFDLQSALLRAESFPALDELAGWLQDNPTVVIRLEGHTDLPGNAEENLTLSRQRVAAVQVYLTRKGIESDRIKLGAYGSARPLKTDCPPPGYCPENRRVEMIILKR